MLVILFRTLIIILLVLITLRLMGKRTIGELQPFEFVIMLVIADLACTPMQDISTPILYGVVPILVLFTVHFFITLVTSKSVMFRKIMNGKPQIIINEDGIDYDTLKKLNMNVNDLLESIRSQEYFSLEQISFAIIETNGNISLLANDNAVAPQSIPLTLIVEGKFIDENLQVSNTHRQKIIDYLAKKNLKLKDIVLMTTENQRLLIQPKRAKYFVETAKGVI